MVSIEYRVSSIEYRVSSLEYRRRRAFQERAKQDEAAIFHGWTNDRLPSARAEDKDLSHQSCRGYRYPAIGTGQLLKQYVEEQQVEFRPIKAMPPACGQYAEPPRHGGCVLSISIGQGMLKENSLEPSAKSWTFAEGRKTRLVQFHPSAVCCDVVSSQMLCL
jgi:hypothetical protein